jgi:hypothetical protein
VIVRADALQGTATHRLRFSYLFASNSPEGDGRQGVGKASAIEASKIADHAIVSKTGYTFMPVGHQQETTRPIQERMERRSQSSCNKAAGTMPRSATHNYAAITQSLPSLSQKTGVPFSEVLYRS